MDFYEMQMKENIKSCNINRKYEFLDAIWNLKESWTGRIDANIVNIFIQEAAQMIINAISVFEQGYFDCAYYSLRQALEIATTMVYLVDIEYEKREDKLSDWKNQRRFPMDNKMKEYLSKNGYIFADMKQNMSIYFEAVENKRKSYNKYVHKQGFKYLYVSRWSMRNQEHIINEEIQTFEEDVIFCIGTVAVMRLAIDPFPILLMDEEIFYRTGDTMTLPYSIEFIEKYIGIDVIEQYKKTNVYKNHYDYIYQEERKSVAVADVVKNQYIDISKLKEILEQVHLLNGNDIVAVKIVELLPHISKVYCEGGLLWYFTNNKTKRKKQSWEGNNFQRFKENTIKYNMVYDEAYISCLKTQGETFFIEHNNKLNENDISLIEKLENEFNSRTWNSYGK
ncbi:teicoplanin resistance protein VanZ [Clostridium perfringens]|uniref:teicoplanin resistance protein VanZ n=1 Tax=Clostridium perfringens TaxID=1502 RepID=UPI0013E3C939|nr:teicoplanin resistance protein VanZ [Clostridium perfringens]NGT50503.1 teicoplanin resistance protein VanZ [Clostridium perfringens]NGT72394.1 teicoplanin resistance protein VanZ [Clostridium perfringens]NGU20621.1 teicoplanin resistance protein VanZ [Clostridium perfringens]